MQGPPAPAPAPVPSSPRGSPRGSPGLFRKLLENQSIRLQRRFTVAHPLWSHGQWQLVERGAVVTVVPDGAISGRDWGPGSGRAPPGHQKLAKRGPRRGLQSEHRGVKDVKGVRLGEGRSLRGPCASVYLSNRWTDTPFPQSVRAPPRCPRHGTTA
ncbi:hypothetical protein J1605_008507 [Eschrichtius robustus]|uniref:Uncharacterized protein n=1 Tax=Eschrichtius robustus TaxID=9764 RepID=A0AB34GYZ5_ESCRO|nr:hypothetical protein J1605_008507 [Eschrichtius robustus]